MKIVTFHALLTTAVFAVAPCYAGKAVVRDGSSMEKAIILKQRGPKAVEEEMAWMMKLHGYTPLLATRDEVAKSATEAVRRLKAGQKQSSLPSPQPWGHATRDHGGQICSYWWFRTPRGKREAYFDTGVSISIPGEVARQELYRADYFEKWVRSLKPLNI
jgi:hypothetical protein